MKTINKIIRYVLAAIAIYRAIMFLVFISSTKPGDQEAAGMSFGAAVICGVIAAVMFYKARNEDVDLTPKPDMKEFRHSDSDISITGIEKIDPPIVQKVELDTKPTDTAPLQSDICVPAALGTEDTPNSVDQPNYGWLIALGALLIVVVLGIVIIIAATHDSSSNVPGSGQTTSTTDELTPTLLAEAKAGNADAQARVGRAYWQGSGVTKDYVQAVFWLRKAAEQGNVVAQVSLGVLYDGAFEKPKGVPQDYVQAAVWYRKAAEQGNDIAEYMLGRLYANGQGVPQDYAQAAVWYRKAAEKGGMMASAQSALGTLYDQGKGVPRDYAKAVALYRKAADQGNADAQLHLGVFYFYGVKNIPRDYAQAADWYRKAADQSNEHAQYLLGQLYVNGQGVPQDYAQAATWFRKAADQGNTDAQGALGVFYAQGTGIPQSYSDAYFWYDLAVAGMKGDERETFIKARDFTAEKLTPLELSQAQEKATVWFASHQQK